MSHEQCNRRALDLKKKNTLAENANMGSKRTLSIQKKKKKELSFKYKCVILLRGHCT